jgi:sugar/nucleoside kinase (ribokinase family)
LTRFAVLGDCTLDIVVEPDRRRRHGGDVAAQIRLGPGGQGANVAVRLARMGRLSTRVRLVAPMADDLAGRLLREALKRDGVSVVALPVPRSAAVAVLLDAHGERTMLSDRQPLAVASAAAALADADWVHCSGYALLDDATGDGVAAALGARPAAIRLSVGGGSVPPEPARVTRFRARLRSAAPQLCLLSRDEAGAMLGRAAPPARLAAARLADLADVVVVTAGAGGSVAAMGGGLLTAPAGEAAGRVLDATGAGDAYAAAMIASLAIGGWPPSAAQLSRAMAAGGRLGARVARVAGAQSRVSGERNRPA